MKDVATAWRAEPRDPEETVGAALRALLRKPGKSLVLAWNRKAALVSAALRATAFFLADQRASRHQALQAGLVEAGFAIVAAGVLAAITQRLRAAQPVWATGLVVWLGLPTLVLPIQAAVHRGAGTPYIRAGLGASFGFAAISSGLTWSLQRRGFFLAGRIAPGQVSRASDRVG